MDSILDQLEALCGAAGISVPVVSPGNDTVPIALSFCTGAGGLDLGLERAGFKIVLACETDSDARMTISKNHPGLPILGDLRDYTAAEVRAAAGVGDHDIDLVAAGVPCQTFSTAGKLRGTADERGEVLPKFIELAMTLAPRYIAIENVRGLLFDVAFDEVVKMLRDGGYVVSWNLYDAVYFGAAQRRDRVIIIASRNGRVPHLTPSFSDRSGGGLPPWRTLWDAIGDMTGVQHHHARYPEKRLKFFRLLKPGQNWRHLPNPAEAMSEATIRATGGKSGYYRRLSWGEAAPTLMTNPTNFLGGCCHPDELRPLSVEEYRRLQGFPDEWAVCGNLQSQYKQLGNAVPVPLGEAVGKAIIHHMHTGRSEDPMPGFRYSRYRKTSDLDRGKVDSHERKFNMDNTLNHHDILEQLQALCGTVGVSVPTASPPAVSPTNPVIQPPPESMLYRPVKNIDCYCCDYRALPVEPGSVSAIVTDVPWEKAWLRHAPEFAKWCVEVLKPGGVMVTWYGQLFLDGLLAGLTQHLHYQWQFISPFYGGSRNQANFITARYRPAVVFSSSESLCLHRSTDDWCPASQRTKDLYRFQQALPPTQYLVEAFSVEDQLVCDPFSGSFTTAEACWHLNRRFIGSDRNPECLGMARRRFAESLTGYDRSSN